MPTCAFVTLGSKIDRYETPAMGMEGELSAANRRHFLAGVAEVLVEGTPDGEREFAEGRESVEASDGLTRG